jgi:hypothetical protein
VEKGEGAFAYRLGLRYTDDKQNASMLLINKENAAKARADRDARNPRKVVLCAGYYDPVTGQSIE